jgi:hypothetical protein
MPTEYFLSLKPYLDSRFELFSGNQQFSTLKCVMILAGDGN